MSALDEDFLANAKDQLGLTAEKIGEFLGVQKQAVYQGVRRETTYFNKARLVSIYRALGEKDSGALEGLRKMVKEIYGHEPSVDTSAEDVEMAFLRESLHIQKTKLPDPKVKGEIWIFTSTPKELEDHEYRRKIFEDFLPDPDRKITYFVPPGRQALSLKGIIGKKLKELMRSGPKKDDRPFAHVEIVEAPCAALVPHLAIINPTSNPTAWVFVDSVAAELPQQSTLSIMNELQAAGIGMDPDQFVPPDLANVAWPFNSFRSLFSSQKFYEEDRKNENR